MKLSKREKIMILILIGLIMIFTYNKLIYQPQSEKIIELQSVLNELKKSKIRSMELLSQENRIYQDYKILNSQVAIAEKSFYPNIIQEKIILQLNGIINSSKLNVISLSFTEPAKKEIKEIEEKKEEKSLLEEYSNIYNDIRNEIEERGTDNNGIEKQNTNIENNKTIKVEKMTANIVFEGNNFNELIDFLTQLEIQEKRIVVDNIGVKMEKNLLSGNIALDYYSIPKIIKTEDDYNNWNIYGSYGVDNPFTFFKGYDTNSSISNANKDVINNNQASEMTQEEVFDFYMGLRPITADLPTVVIGKYDDIHGNSYIYGDNPGRERVEFEFLKKDDKYYYKYKTELQNLPDNYEKEFLPFNPRGKNIVLKIVSVQRKEANDNSGIYLFLTNNTDLKLEVDIDNDSRTKPRINIAKKQGDIVISQ